MGVNYMRTQGVNLERILHLLTRKRLSILFKSTLRGAVFQQASKGALDALDLDDVPEGADL